MNSVFDKIKAVLGESAVLEHPKVESFGDWSCNLAKLQLKSDKVNQLISNLKKIEEIETVEIKSGNFLNIRLRNWYFVNYLDRVLKEGVKGVIPLVLDRKRVIVEFAHPNTHKELHVGHMRTLTLGESLSRVFSICGAKVFRANYQGDIGPHVAKALWGTERLLKQRGLSFEEADKLEPLIRAHLLGEGYVEGNKYYEDFKTEIDGLNKKLYKMDISVIDNYRTTRRWSLDYYDLFYTRFGTKFDKLYFESEVAAKGKEIVEQNLGRVFDKSDGALIFDGEKFGLHKRVFVTSDGNPTYEGKEMALAFEQYKDFEFDRIVHVVANEQTGYFQVVIKALEQIDPKFVGRQYHLPMGMVNLVGKKISSRTGEVVTVDSLLDEVKTILPEAENKEAITMAAVKYAILKVGPEQNVAFDVKQSINIEGNSGPYLQYTYARTCSVLAKSKALNPNNQTIINFQNSIYEYNDAEVAILRWLERFPEVVVEAGLRYAPNMICTYLYELAQRFNTFYNKYSILSPNAPAMTGTPSLIKEGEGGVQGVRNFRLKLTAGVGEVLKTGLNLLGIEAIARM